MTNVIAALVATWMVAVDLMVVLVGFKKSEVGMEGHEWAKRESK